jgi:glucan phosphoethanolaminetransferase (alkaline phosphatase superfamily)
MKSTAARPRLAWVTRTEPLLLAVCLFWALLANRPFVAAALQGRDAQAPQTWLFGAALLVMLVCLHYLIVAPFAWGALTKPLLALLLVVVASATHFMQAFGVVLDPSMIRNVLHTDVAESRELMSWRLAPTCCCTPGCRCCCCGACACRPALGFKAWRGAWAACCWRWRCWWARCWRCTSRCPR